ncbi:hypothetical protein HID58_020410 [Brassica napus]|uniref:Reticulon-like protein n=1 Tax=Brassica napus TaxID=3708 RepID=A0ABQ7XH32_BRANA|nr:hypothetical protein HID58_020410 [Brassica napus]
MPEKNIVEKPSATWWITSRTQFRRTNTIPSLLVSTVCLVGRSQFTTADVLLWRNKKISASFLMGATAIWVLFEWINLHFLSLVCYGLLLGMIAQFVWCNASGFLNRLECLALFSQKTSFADVGVTIGTEVNRGLFFLQDLSCRGNLKQFLMAVFGLWITAIIGSCCNFLTVLYIGFVGAHTMPVVYERYEDEVDGFWILC